MDDFESLAALHAEAEDYARENALILAALEAEYGPYVALIGLELPF